VFNLVAMEGLNHVEVGQLLNISENTSRSQYSRARALLMRWIQEEESDTKKLAKAQ
jgi:RNA polymerase sigma-70 factor (ECF subfamily)